MSEPSTEPLRTAKVDHAQAEARLDDDAERYAELAVELGASASRAIDAGEVVVDDRVVYKCRIPKCKIYGTCANCPPHAPGPEEVRHLVRQYERAVVFKIDLAPEVLLSDPGDKEWVDAFGKVSKIVGALESAAFYDGHYLSTGFAAGSCRTVLCGKQDCTVLESGECRQPLKARPSMEAASMDVFALAEKLGWDMYPIGRSVGPQCVPSVAVVGLVLIG